MSEPICSNNTQLIIAWVSVNMCATLDKGFLNLKENFDQNITEGVSEFEAIQLMNIVDE